MRVTSASMISCMTRFLPLAAVAMVICLASGCATSSGTATVHMDSGTPWNAPQRWESVEIHNDGSVESNSIMVAGHLFYLGEFIAALLRH